MRTSNRHVFSIILMVVLLVAGTAPSAAQEAFGGGLQVTDEGEVTAEEEVDSEEAEGAEDSVEADDESGNEQVLANAQSSRVKAKLVVDCKSKKSKNSPNKKVKKFCKGKKVGGKGGRNAVSSQGSGQQTFDCGTLNLQVADIGGGIVRVSFWGQSTLGNVLGGGWEIIWKNQNTGVRHAPSGSIEPDPGNPTFFLDSFSILAGRGRVATSLTGFVVTQGGLCLFFPPVIAEETVLR